MIKDFIIFNNLLFREGTKNKIGITSLSSYERLSAQRKPGIFIFCLSIPLSICQQNHKSMDVHVGKRRQIIFICNSILSVHY